MSEARSIRPVEEKPELVKYELHEEVGHGGMASVYRAVDRRLGREVAVKVIHKHLRESGEVATRFTSEARAVAKLRHPNIVEVYDVSDEGEEDRYLVVELVRGTTLRKLLKAQSKLPAEIAAAIALEIAAALEHAHKHGVVHRDVKPENVLVELAGETPSPEQESDDSSPKQRALIKITDFGIAKLLDMQGVTSTGQVLGSPAHMAPEQIEGDEVTARADVFALGVLFYECMVGALPFDGSNPAQVLRRVLEGSHPGADRVRPTVGVGWSRIVDRALCRDPAHRYQSAAEFAGQLRAELERLGFERPREELAEYLSAPEQYWVKYVPRVVDRLVELGQKAYAARAIPQAAACFNRALAFRPDDPALLRHVTGLAHTQRVRRTLVRASAVAAMTVLLAAGAYGVARLVRSTGWLSGGGQSDDSQTAQDEKGPATRPIAVRDVRPVDSAGLGAARARSAKKAARRPRVRTVVRPARKTRKVRVNIKGAKGSLTIQGQPKPWFGKKVTHELEVGRTYTFGFVPPNDQCCVGMSKSVTIPEGEGVLPVEGKISFRDATLSTSRVPAGSTVSCEIYGLVTAPAPLRVPMERAEAVIRCIVIERTTGKKRTIQATLRPGRTTLLSWP